MRTTRREVLAGLGALPVVIGCHGGDEPPGGSSGPTSAPDRPPEPPEWDAPGDQDDVAFAWSVQAGDPLPDGVILGVKSTEPELALIVVGAVDDGWEEVDRRSGLVPEDGEVQVELTGLSADRAHRYVFTTADGARRSRIGRFRTALPADGYRKLVIGATSCLGDADPTWPNLAFVADHQVDVFLLLGDTVYADGAVTREQYGAFWDAAYATPSLAGALASTGIVGIWDDHEVANNWVLGEGSNVQTGITEQQLADGRFVFQQRMPQRTTATGPLYRSFTWGTVVELIALDCRGERTEDRIVSDEQLAWAIERIRTSECWLKLVLVSVHVTDHTALLATVEAQDRWQGYPAQRDPLVAAAAETPNVLFVTGDMHYGAIQRIAQDGDVGDDVREVAAGPSGSELLTINELADLLGGLPPQYEDVVQDWTWAKLEIDPGLGEVRVQLIGDTGEALVDRVLTFTPAG